MTDAVLLDVERGIARITLNRPEKLNAFDEAMIEDWAAVTTEAVSRDDVRAVMIVGNGRVFSAGGDVAAMSRFADREPELRRLAERLNVGLLALLESSVPVVSAVQGMAVGGGLGVLLATDYAVAGESTEVGSLYARVGLTPDMTVSALLGRAVGERRALQLTLQDRLLTAAEALDWGLVAEVTPDAEVLERAEAVARHWVANAPHAYGNAKRLLRAASEASLRDQLADEARTIGAASVVPETDARMRAFAEKSSTSNR